MSTVVKGVKSPLNRGALHTPQKDIICTEENKTGTPRRGVHFNAVHTKKENVVAMGRTYAGCRFRYWGSARKTSLGLKNGQGYGYYDITTPCECVSVWEMYGCNSRHNGESEPRYVWQVPEGERRHPRRGWSNKRES
jgi:hypothetical protein